MNDDIECIDNPTKTRSGIPLFTPLEEALEEIQKRSKDEGLRKKVLDYLQGDIPDYFDDSPIIYYARHIITPNYETLRFLDIAKTLKFPAYISSDGKDKFTTKNFLKRSLGKLRITKGDTPNLDDLETYSIIDFDSARGKRLHEVETLWGQNLIDFHAELFKKTYGDKANIVDDSAWIDRNNRGDIVEHYKRFFTLSIAHGVMFETYTCHEQDLVDDVLTPTYDFLIKTFGCKPLVVDFLPEDTKSSRMWEAYPQSVAPMVRKKLSRIQSPSLLARFTRMFS